MRTQGITPSCSTIWHRGATAVLGISPFNSYFDEDRIQRLIGHCRRDGREAIVFVPDEVTRFTLEAKGYPAERAVQKTRRQVRYLRNKVARATAGAPVRVLGCAELAGIDGYLRHHAALERRFGSDAAFRQGCLDTTRWALAAAPEDEVSEPAMLLGVRYLLAELPLFLHAPEIIGRREVAFVYPQCPGFVADLFRGRYGDAVSPGQAFVEIAEGEEQRFAGAA